MKKIKSLYLIGLLSFFVLILGCGGKGIGAGHAVAGFSELGCVAGQWYYEVNGHIVGSDTGCTTMNQQGAKDPKEAPWCATGVVNKNGKQVYVGGSGKWKPCAKEQSGPVSCLGGTKCDGTPVTGSVGQVVCGTNKVDLTHYGQWMCTSQGWISNGICECPKSVTSGSSGVVSSDQSKSTNPPQSSVKKKGCTGFTSVSQCKPEGISPSQVCCYDKDDLNVLCQQSYGACSCAYIPELSGACPPTKP